MYIWATWLRAKNNLGVKRKPRSEEGEKGEKEREGKEEKRGFVLAPPFTALGFHLAPLFTDF